MFITIETENTIEVARHIRNFEYFCSEDLWDEDNNIHDQLEAQLWGLA